MLARKLNAMGFIARIEPRIPTVEGTKIPDLCAWKDSAYVVCDVALGSDTADLDKIHFSKVSKYDLPGILRLGGRKTIQSLNLKSRKETSRPSF